MDNQIDNLTLALLKGLAITIAFTCVFCSTCSIDGGLGIIVAD